MAIIMPYYCFFSCEAICATKAVDKCSNAIKSVLDSTAMSIVLLPRQLP